MSDVINITIDGSSTLPLRPTVSKSMNTFWAALNRKKDGSRFFSKYGVNVPASMIGSTTPSSVEVCGTKFDLEQDITEKGQARFRAAGEVTVPGHGKKEFTLRITVLDDEAVNLSASVHGKSSGGASRHVLDEL